MSEFWNDLIPRLIGIAAALLVTWGAKHGITLNAEELTALFVAIYAIVHRGVTAGRESVRAGSYHRALRRAHRDD